MVWGLKDKRNLVCVEKNRQIIFQVPVITSDTGIKIKRQGTFYFFSHPIEDEPYALRLRRTTGLRRIYQRKEGLPTEQEFIYIAEYAKDEFPRVSDDLSKRIILEVTEEGEDTDEERWKAYIEASKIARVGLNILQWELASRFCRFYRKAIKMHPSIKPQSKKDLTHLLDPLMKQAVLIG